MRSAFVVALAALTACTVQQRDSDRAVAAFEVPLPSPDDKAAFLALLRRQAALAGYHVDAASADDLRVNSEVSPITFNAAVWRGEDDDEVIASAMDQFDHLGRVWLTFSVGQDRGRVTKFRKGLMRGVARRWPLTRSLPIMPTGAIPLASDLIPTASGYRVNPAAANKYRIAPTPRPSSTAR